jgi:hypothetical protein
MRIKILCVDNVELEFKNLTRIIVNKTVIMLCQKHGVIATIQLENVLSYITAN